MQIEWRVVMATWLILGLAACASQTPRTGTAQTPPSTGNLRVATFNVSLYDSTAGTVLARLRGGQDERAKRLAEIVQHQAPDVLLLNEVDYDAGGALATVLQREYLEVSQKGKPALVYPHRFFAPVNTGLPTGLDLNHDGCVGGPNDAFGFGRYPGQYGMLVLSKFPIDTNASRTFQQFKWKDLPGAASPINPANGRPWYPTATWNQLRLSSKSHWDVVIQAPLGEFHFLVSHPTPPVFDGPEDRNGIRNRDELRFWSHYLNAGPSVLVDDQGRTGGLDARARFVIAGDLNNDPNDGEGIKSGIRELLAHPRLARSDAPLSAGAREASALAGGSNAQQHGDAAHDTGAFHPNVGNLRLDYVLPSRQFKVIGQGVAWPSPASPEAKWNEASDHHLVWVDLQLQSP